MIEQWSEEKQYVITLSKMGGTIYKRLGCNDCEIHLIFTRCPCGYVTRKYSSVDFRVEVIDNSIRPMGVYWRYYIEELMKIAREKNMNVIIDLE